MFRSILCYKIDIVGDESGEENGEYILPVIENKEYVCVAKSSLCAFYLPKCNRKETDSVHVENVKLDLKPRANEIVIAPVIHITSQALTISEDKPAMIELMKTVELSEKQGNNLIILFSRAIPVKLQDWKELGVESHSEELNDRIRFKVRQLGFFTAIARCQMQPLSSSAKLSPGESDTSDPIELVIPGVSEFKMQIPHTNVLTEATVSATAHYDDAILCMESNEHRLATACVTFEPQNLNFDKPIQVSLVIPGYDEIMKRYPKAEIQFLSGATNTESSKRGLEWEINHATDFQISRHGNNFIATTQSNYLCPLKFMWRGIPTNHQELGPKHEYHKSIMQNSVKGFSARCQVFMSGVTHVRSEHLFSFNIAVLVYPYQASKAYENLDQYDYSLMDSGSFPCQFKGSELNCILELKECLFPGSKADNTEQTSTASLSGNFCSRMEFEVELHESVKLKGVLGNLFIKHADEKTHILRLRLVSHNEFCIYK